MFGISAVELGVIFLVLIVVFGPEKLPELASSIGKLMGQFRKQTDGIRREFYNSVYTPAKEIESEIRDSSRKLETAAIELGEDLKKSANE